MPDKPSAAAEVVAIAPLVTPESLYRDHRAALMTVAALTLDDQEQAKEVVHDAFVEIIARWETIDPLRAVSYLYRTVSNACMSGLRRRRTARGYRPDAVPHVPGADTAVLHAEGFETILRAVRELPMKQRQVIVLRYYAEFDLATIAEILGMTVNAVAVNAHRGRKTLQKLWEQQG